MAQTRDGVVKILARKAGITIDEYLSKVKSLEKWCWRCIAWHPHSDFGSDKARSDGLDSSCKKSRNNRTRELYEPIPPVLKRPHGPARHAARHGDKQQARHHVNLSVQGGRLPAPQSLKCFDCGHFGEDRRHEYDHFLGYTAEFHLSVQAVCSQCHHDREMARGTAGRNPGKLSKEIASKVRESQELNKVLAARYNVSDDTIGKIKRGDTWREAGLRVQEFPR